jgi:hypothetical protein
MRRVRLEDAKLLVSAPAFVSADGCWLPGGGGGAKSVWGLGTNKA